MQQYQQARAKQPGMRTASTPASSHLFLGWWPFLIPRELLRLDKLVCVIDVEWSFNEYSYILISFERNLPCCFYG